MNTSFGGASNRKRRFDSGDPGGVATRNSGMQELTVDLHIVKDRTKGISGKKAEVLIAG